MKLRKNRKKFTPEENEMIQILKSSAKTIQDLNCDKTRFMLDMNYRGTGFLNSNSWHEEIVAKYDFFISIIGMIEAKIIDYSRKATIEFNREKNQKLTNYIDSLVGKRKEIIETYLKSQSNYDLPVVNRILSNSFVFFQLDEIYKDLELTNYKYKLHQEFVSAYNNGSKLADNCKLKNIINVYEQLYFQCVAVNAHNESTIIKTGNAKTLKKIASDEHFAKRNCD